MGDSCPSLEEFLGRSDDPAYRQRILDHASDCPHCLDLLEWALEGTEILAEQARPRWKQAILWTFSAAASLLVMAAGIVFFGSRAPRSPKGEVSYVLPPGERLLGSSGELIASTGSDRLFQLWDESRLKLEGGSRARFQAIERGDRVCLQVLSGAVEAEVPPGPGIFRVTAEAGEVHVLGTRFRIKTFRLHGALPCLCVEVYEGKVAFKGPRGEMPLSSGERAVIVGRSVMERQAIGQDWRGALESYAKLLRSGPDGFQLPPEAQGRADLLAGILFGSRWEEPVDLDESPEDSPAIRESKLRLRKASE